MRHGEVAKENLGTSIAVRSSVVLHRSSSGHTDVEADESGAAALLATTR
jgi:hypothetical protein